MKNKIDIRRSMIILVTLLFFAFQMYIAFIKPLPPLIQNPIHLVLALLVAFLWYPINMKAVDSWKKHLYLIDVVIIGLLAFSAYYFLTSADRLMYRIQYLDPLSTLDHAMLFVIMILLLEAVRRVLGLNLLIFVGIFLAYAWFGNYMPGMLKHSGTNLSQFTDLMVMGSDGIFGAPLNASAGFLYYFIIFGGLFAACGGGQILIDIGMKYSKKSAGGPAIAAITSSSLLGMINGSAVANVSTTGVMTIPLMIKVGYKPTQAGAIEAVASTSGQIMPPIMGIGAFVMAEMTGIPYSQIALADIIPAIAYVGSLFILVSFIAKKDNLTMANNVMNFEIEPILRRLYLLLPIFVVIYNIIQGSSLMYAALNGIGAVLVINLLRFGKALGPKVLFETLLQSTKQVAQIAIPIATAGIIIGVVVMSGLATTMASVISGIGYMWIALLITSFGCIILGMALPTVAAYLAAYILFIPVLLRLGVPALPANMFIFYFGIIAQITPPVCLASFAAAGIAKASAWETGWLGFRYALSGFLIPFVFVFKPEILLMGTVTETILATTIMFIGTTLLVASISGYLFVPLEKFYERTILLVAAVLSILPETLTSVIGLLLGATCAIYFYRKKKKYVPVAA